MGSSWQQRKGHEQKCKGPHLPSLHQDGRRVLLVILLSEPDSIPSGKCKALHKIKGTVTLARPQGDGE